MICKIYLNKVKNMLNVKKITAHNTSPLLLIPTDGETKAQKASRFSNLHKGRIRVKMHISSLPVYILNFELVVGPVL